MEEILLRFPPHEPALLFRASLVCKRWCRLVSGPCFRRRSRELHPTPPMLGFLCSIADNPDDATAGFVTTSAFCSTDADLGDCSPLDARHGRVLLQGPGSSTARRRQSLSSMRVRVNLIPVNIRRVRVRVMFFTRG